MEQLVLLLVIAAISLVNWLIERSSKLREQRRREKEAALRGESSPQPASTLPETSGREEIEDQMRRMLESFGFPVEPTKPPTSQHPPVVAIEPPVAPPPLPKPRSFVDQAPFRQQKQPARFSRERSPWLKRLDSPAGLREAVVLREILGPPKALCEP